MTTAKHGSKDALFRNDKTESYMITIVLVAIALTLNQALLFVKADVPNEPHTANAMWIEPSHIDLSAHTHDIGYKFNVTIWVNITSVPSPKQVVTAWQLVIIYDKTQLNATRCGYTAGTKSQFFSNITTIPLEPQFGSFNTTHNFVMHGENWGSGPKRNVPGYGSLSWVEFQVIAKPPEGQVYTSLIDLVTTGTRISKILDDQLSKTSFTSYPSTYRYGTYVYGPIPIKPGQNATIESNVVITKTTVTKNTLHFEATGPSGSTGWINITFPKINTTAIKVFIDGHRLKPPPFPIIITNGTHYFIYFEFTLSTHEIAIQFGPADDVAVTNVMSSKTVVGQGYSLRINITLANPGSYTETFNVTAYANTTIIATLTNITLTSGNSTTITFTWNTTGFAKGNYTISAIADTVPGETDTADNSLTDGWIVVTVIGDINGDFKVDIKDLVLVIKYFGSYPGSVKPWNPNADINCDNKVDIKDLVLLIKHYGEHV